MNEKITVFIHDGDELPRAIIVGISDSIRILDDFIKEKGQRAFYCNGSIILPAFSFNYFNIKNNDHIFVVRLKDHKPLHNMMMSNQQPTPKKSLTIKEKVEKIKNFKENQQKQYPLQPDTHLLHEASRIADLTYIQNEHSMLFRNYFSSGQEEPSSRNKTLEIKQQTLITSSTLPSSEALPQVWRTF